MNRKEAEKILDNTFNHEFNKSSFVNFLNELLNGFYLNEKIIGTHTEYENNISSIRKLGNFKDKTKSMEIYIVKLKKSSTLERARTLQRNVIAKLLKNFNLDSAIVAFYSENSPDWRFSLIRMDYKLLEDGKVSTELTPARRHSFLVGKNEPNHTCKKQLLNLVMRENEKPTFKEIENAFSIENVTKEFFEKYKNLFIKLKENLEKIVENDPEVKKEFDKKNISVIEFSKKLLGQIVFLYFLQKKGWLGVKKSETGKFEEWGTSSKKFVQELFEDAIKQNKNFFNDYLEPLFYEALAEDRRANGNYYSRFDCRIPFLNGGLFEPINNYNWQETNIILNNNLLKEVLDTFNEFNFTIKEDEPLEKEVAVDPEMLGKVFENLLDIVDRKSKGAFYTPREIVHYMCQQSLINYLETNSNLKRKDLEIFIQKGDLALDYLRRAQIRKGVKNELILPESIYKNQELLDKLLQKIKIVDPAVGSGAFPVGMMNEIIKARKILNYFIPQQNGKPLSDYELKRETIENSLYGVDIEPSAVEITKLRFWLSLIVDEENMDNIQPLPNLENRIMCGNSLIEEFEGVKLYKDPLEIQEYKEQQSTLDDISTKAKKSEMRLKDLRKKQKEFFDESNRTKKNELRREIEKIELEFIEETLKEQNNPEALEKLKNIKKNGSKPFFLWKLYFSDVFEGENPGFDVVIGNPPYVSVKGISKEDKKFLSKSLETGKGRFNLFTLFLEKGHKLIRKEGVLTFIIPEGIYTNVEYRHIREYILKNSEILYSVLFDYRLFEASVDTTIFSIKNKVPHKNHAFPVYKNLNELTISLSQEELFNFPFSLFPVNLNDLTKPIIEKVFLNKFKISNFLEIQQGIIYSGQPKEKVFSNEKRNKNFKKVLDGRDVLKWKINWENKKENKFICYTNKLHRPREERLFLSKEKILLPRKSVRINCGFDCEKFYALNTAYIMLPLNSNIKLKYLLACLNSRLINFYYSSLFFGWQITIPAINSIGIKKISPAKQKPFIEIVDKILSITKDEDYLKNPEKQAMVKAYERRIDKMVYELYNLTPEEIKIVEEFGK